MISEMIRHRHGLGHLSSEPCPAKHKNWTVYCRPPSESELPMTERRKARSYRSNGHLGRNWRRVVARHTARHF